MQQVLYYPSGISANWKGQFYEPKGCTLGKRLTAKFALKVLSSEMDPAEISFIRLVVIKKWWGAEVFRQVGPSSFLWEPCKVIVRLLVLFIGIFLETNWNGGDESS